jgi:hypothetical protein
MPNKRSHPWIRRWQQLEQLAKLSSYQGPSNFKNTVESLP